MFSKDKNDYSNQSIKEWRGDFNDKNILYSMFVDVCRILCRESKGVRKR